ncbi:MAG TPA: hypothetical protein PKE65_06045, partial [Rhizobiaceae bacterium]|nr:hypothetical protein [Rhizobiaceae bacterium]
KRLSTAHAHKTEAKIVNAATNAETETREAMSRAIWGMTNSCFCCIRYMYAFCSRCKQFFRSRGGLRDVVPAAARAPLAPRIRQNKFGECRISR